MTEQVDIWADRRVRIGYETAEELARCYNRENWRAHPENQRAATEDSLDTLGLIGQIKKSTVSNLMFDGHLRVELALAKNPQMLLPVDYYDLTDDETALALTIHDAITEQAEPIADKLAALLERTRAMTADRPGLGAMLERLKLKAGINGHQKTEEGPPQIDKAAELQKVWGVKVGDVWELGQHWLVCGDCTDRATVEAVMRGERADCLCWDPPFNIGFDYDGEFKGEDSKNPEDYKKWLNLCLENCGAILADLHTCFVWQGMPNIKHFPDWFGLYDWRLISVAKGFVQARPAWLQWATDPVIAWSSDKSTKPISHRDFFYNGQSANTKQTSDRILSGYHPCPRSTEVVEYFMNGWTEGNSIVIDMCSGSGTVIIAAENLGRKVRAIELNPGYCAVTLERWSQLTGQTPRRVPQGEPQGF